MESFIRVLPEDALDDVMPLQNPTLLESSGINYPL